jgi:hypothetical protein
MTPPDSHVRPRLRARARLGQSSSSKLITDWPSRTRSWSATRWTTSYMSPVSSLGTNQN